MIYNWFNSFDSVTFVVEEIMRHRCVQSFQPTPRGIMIRFCDGKEFRCVPWDSDKDNLARFARYFNGLDFDYTTTRLISC